MTSLIIHGPFPYVRNPMLLVFASVFIALFSHNFMCSSSVCNVITAANLSISTFAPSSVIMASACVYRALTHRLKTVKPNAQFGLPMTFSALFSLKHICHLVFGRSSPHRKFISSTYNPLVLSPIPRHTTCSMAHTHPMNTSAPLDACATQTSTPQHHTS